MTDLMKLYVLYYGSSNRLQDSDMKFLDKAASFRSYELCYINKKLFYAPIFNHYKEANSLIFEYLLND